MNSLAAHLSAGFLVLAGTVSSAAPVRDAPGLARFSREAQRVIITRDVWDKSAPRHPGEPDARPLLDIVQTFKGLDVADGMRNVEVMVVRRKEKKAE